MKDKKTLTFSNYLVVGSMLFGLFFGAGNLIFPVHLGQAAGSHTPIAVLGFIVTGVGLPFLGVAAIGFSKSQGLYDLASRVSPRFGLFMTLALYLTIGPFFALPRTATVSFEVGLKSLIADKWLAPSLFLFSVLFFALAWWFSLTPSRIMTWIGKILNPLFLLFLSILIIRAFTNPIGAMEQSVVSPEYQNNPFFTGFIDGYNTMDVLASLAFGIIVVNSLKSLGVESPTQIAKDTFKAGSISLLLMSVIYGSLAFMGASSTHKFPLSENGGIALGQLANYYFGSFGSILLTLIVTFACLKTAIGLITACSETFAELFPKYSYKTFVHLFSLISCAIANVGLTSIIQLAVPVLMFLYPLAISLVALAFLAPLFKERQTIFRATITTAFIFSFVDLLNSAPQIIRTLTPIQWITKTINTYLPFASINMAWVLPTLIVFLVSWLYCSLSKKA